MARRLYEESEGQPFFLSELVREVLRGEPASQLESSQAFDSVVPPARSGVQTLIAARMNRLSPEARLLAEVASVAGAAFSVELIREVNGRGEFEVLHHLDELLDRGLVSELAGGVDVNYAFTHHLIQAAIYSAIPAELASRRHRRIAHVMEELYPQHLDELSVNWLFISTEERSPSKQAQIISWPLVALWAFMRMKRPLAFCLAPSKSRPIR